MHSPIGVFDSGVGGLSVLHHMREGLPREDLLYVADSAHAPYGGKTPEQIKQRSLALARFLKWAGRQGIGHCLQHCNCRGRSVAARKFRHPHRRHGAGGQACRSRLAQWCGGCAGYQRHAAKREFRRIVGKLRPGRYGGCTQAAHGLVECVERGEIESPATRALLWKYLEPLLAEGADTLVLGCTHYPSLRRPIESMVEIR